MGIILSCLKEGQGDDFKVVGRAPNHPEILIGCPIGVVVRQPCYSECAEDQSHHVGSCGSCLDMQHLGSHPDLEVQNQMSMQLCAH